MSTGIVHYSALCNKHFCLLQNGKILCCSRFISFRRIRNRVRPAFGPISENLGPGADLVGSTPIVSCYPLFPTFLPFKSMKKYLLLFSFYLVQYVKMSKIRAHFRCVRGLGQNLGKFHKVICIFSDCLLC